MVIFDLISLHLGRLIICLLGAFIAVTAVYFIYNWLVQCSRYTWLIFKAEAFHGDVIKEDFKKKRWWKPRFVLRVFFGDHTVELALMGSHDNCHSDRWFFSRKEAYVKGKHMEENS